MTGRNHGVPPPSDGPAGDGPAGDGPAGDGDRWVTELLQGEANRYEPDLTRIRRRIDSREPSVGGVRPRRATGPRWHWGTAASAAGFVAAVTVASLAVAGGFDVRPAGSRSGPVRVLPSDPPVTSADGGQATVPPSPTATPDGAPATTEPDTSPPVRRSADREPGVRVDVRAVDPGRAVDLDGSDDGDWIVAGGREDGGTVRREGGAQLISGPHVTGHPTTSVTPGAFVVSWTGGNPERSCARCDTWLAVRAPQQGPRTGFLVSAPAVGQDSTLTLYVGSAGANARLRVRLGENEADETVLRSRGGTSAYVVTIRFHTRNSGSLDAFLDVGSGGTVALAAATLH